MKKDKNNFCSPMHLACSTDELRPVLNCIHCINGNLYSSNGYMLAKQSLEFSSVIQPEKLEGKAIHMDSYKQILEFTYVTCEDDHIHCVDENGRSAQFDYQIITDTVPDFDKILENHSVQGVEYIGVNPKFITIAGKILAGSEIGMKLDFNGTSKGFICSVVSTGYENQMVYITPVLIDGDLFTK